ncbi:MAG: glycosyltransferase family 4 protein [Proteobacteria bacterium]|nr:glycosyltransferase family 4 protein [Pseudomonadota bacterium]
MVTHKFARGDGQGRVNHEIAQAALAAGHVVWLVAAEIAPELAAHPRARPVILSVGRWPTALVRNQVFALKAGRWLRAHRASLDVVHGNGFVAWSAVDVSSAHFVHAAWLRSRFHTFRVRKDPYGLYQFIYTACGRWLEAWSYRHARRVVAVSSQVRDELVATGLEPANIRVIVNGVDALEFQPGSPDRAALGLPQGPLLLFAGDLRTPRKNLDTLLHAMTGVEGATLAVAGDATGSPYLRMARDLGIEHKCVFLGYRRDIPALMRAADVFVFPSRYEACSLVLLEAAASGLPLVVGRHTGGAELLTPDAAMLLEDPEDAQALRQALNQLLRDPRRLAAMGAEARRIAMRNSWRVMADRYLELYEELQAQPAGARPASRVPETPHRERVTS